MAMRPVFVPFAVGLAVFAFAAPADAECQPTMSFSNNVVTATASGNCGSASVSIGIDGRLRGSTTCWGETTCTVQVPIACEPGPHTVDVRGSCPTLKPGPDGTIGCYIEEKSISTNVTVVPIPPAVSVSYEGPGAEGHGTLIIPYTFPEHTPRRLEVHIDGVFAFSAPDSELQLLHARPGRERHRHHGPVGSRVRPQLRVRRSESARHREHRNWPVGHRQPRGFL